MTYRIYGYEGCAYCAKAAQFLFDISEPFETVYLETKEERNAFLDRRNIQAPNRTWPQIVRIEPDGAEWQIGGYRQLLNEFLPADQTTIVA